MSMIWSSVSSSISWGGRLGPLHVSRSQRQTVALELREGGKGGDAGHMGGIWTG